MNEMRRLMEMVGRSVEGDIIASADEFTVVNEHGMVHIIDGEQTVRVTMQLGVWEELCASSSGASTSESDLKHMYDKGYEAGWREGFEDGYQEGRDQHAD